MDQDIAIEVKGITKNFGGYTAIKNLSFSVTKAELFGIVGPDGAGKTTILRLLMGILLPTSGEVMVFGVSVGRYPEKVRESIGYMSQRFGLYEDLTVEENMEFYCDLYGVDRKERKRRMEELLDFSGLYPFKKRLAGHLSGGMKQKLGLTCALIHRPDILILDEPTAGVDPLSRRDFWRILYGLRNQGMTIVLSTAYLDEAERCTRIGLIYRGEMPMLDRPNNIRSSLGISMVEVVLSETSRARDILLRNEYVDMVTVYGDRLHIGLKEKEQMDSILDMLRSYRFEIKGSREVIPSLEDVFIKRIR
ncbi:MAG: ABC transporter ATP-binding protein [Syntrophorhabdaceae bacterium]|nr:ABC transporter ATP-binding protein [Syntrophorhabdaceae bacterium]